MYEPNYEDDDFLFEEDKMGMRITAGSVSIEKDENNMIGISIGGGAPNCPCLYIVQIFDNSPASKDGFLESGDEIIGVNGIAVKGKTKVEVAKLIQSMNQKVTISYHKLHADPKQGKTLDIILKKVKHRIVENMSSTTADALGLSRAILCNDNLLKKLKELQRVEYMYKGIVEHIKLLVKANLDMFRVYKTFGDSFAQIGVREPQSQASEAFSKFGEAHRNMEKGGIDMLRTVKPILEDINTFLEKAVPDTKLTIKKYADVKFEYLSYCLKVKEMDDEEHSYQVFQEPLYRIETGNYEYRLILRCRQDARSRFAKLRSDVLVKLELLNQKHAQDIVHQLKRFIKCLSNFHNNCFSIMNENIVFPIEIDLSKSCTYNYLDSNSFQEDGEEATSELLANLESNLHPSINNEKQLLSDLDLLGLN